MKYLPFICALWLLACNFQTTGPISNDERIKKITKRTASVADIRAELEKIPYSPGGKGFEYMATQDPGDLEVWAKENAPIVKWALEQLPGGFSIQVTGHTCNIGPREKNLLYSKARAQTVLQALLARGLPGQRLTATGVAYDEPLPGLGEREQAHRRVTLKVILGP